MKKATLIQKVKPFVLFLLMLTILLLTVSFVRSDGLNKVPVREDNNLRLSASSKYSASKMEGLDNNANAKTVNSKAFSGLIAAARQHPRGRKMTDLTKLPEQNSMQTLMNTWMEGSFSPVHYHEHYSEAFVVLDGALAFFTFNDDGTEVKCHVLHGLSSDADRLIIVEKKQYHAMTAAPTALGWPGHAVVFETSGHVYDASASTKTLATFAPVFGDGMDGDPGYFKTILGLCPVKS